MKSLLLILAVILGFAFHSGLVFPDQVAPDQSAVTFSINHLGGKVTGTFSGIEGSVIFDENNLGGSSMDVSLDAKTIDTKNRARDKDLRGKKFFDVENYPRVHFKSLEIIKVAEGYEVRGQLTIKDVTREEIIPFKVEKQGEVRVFSGAFTVNRKNYNLGKSSFPPIGKEAKVEIKAVVK
jgi:polyisoprenoid-binding protein YceI